MKNNETISELMRNDHRKIRNLISELDLNFTQEKFDNLKWELERHLLTEETAIISSLQDDTERITNSIQRLLDDHEILRSMLKNMEENSEEKGISSLSNLKDFFSAHENYEETSFYTKLEEELQEKQKQRVIEKIKAI